MSELSTYDYATMRWKVTSLEIALSNAIAADRSEAASFFTGLKRLLKHGTDVNAEEQRFTADAERLVGMAKAAMASIVAKCEGTLFHNGPVPRQLEADAEKWSTAAADTDQLRAEAASLIGLPGWSGDAQQRYDVAARVQKEALTELKGIFTSTAQSCTAGATLNRAIFCAVGKGATQASGRIIDKQGAGAANDMYYMRTANAIPVLEAFDALVGRAISGEVVTGSAGVLSGEHDATLGMTNLLPEGGWPTGTAAAGISAAATEGGVSSDGEDAKTRLDAFLNMCMAGTNL